MRPGISVNILAHASQPWEEERGGAGMKLQEDSNFSQSESYMNSQVHKRVIYLFKLVLSFSIMGKENDTEKFSDFLKATQLVSDLHATKAQIISFKHTMYLQARGASEKPY